MARSKGIGPIGEPVIVMEQEPSFAETYSVTAMLQLQEKQPVIISDARTDTNTQIDFVEFLWRCIRIGALKSGDVIIVDNASIHVADDTTQMLSDLLEAAGVKLIFLPKYSSELNPVELVFMFVKRMLRDYRKDTSVPLWIDVASAFACVDFELAKSFYKKCFLSK